MNRTTNHTSVIDGKEILHSEQGITSRATKRIITFPIKPKK